MSTLTQKSSFRETISAGLTLDRGRLQKVDEAKVSLDSRELNALTTLRESQEFKAFGNISNLDHHDFRRILSSATTEPVSFCGKLGKKIENLLSEGKINENLELDNTLIEGVEQVEDRSKVGLARFLSESLGGKSVDEGLGSSTTDDHEGMADHGKALSSDSDKSEPKGDADSGTTQKTNHGDDAYADKGYQSESDKEESKDDEDKDDEDKDEKYEQKGGVPDKKPSYQDQMPDRKNGDMKEGNFDPADKQHNQPKGDDDKKGVNEEETDEGELPPALQKKKIPAGSDADGDGKTNEGKEPPKDAPLATKPTAADDARYAHGKKQNEGEEQAENSYGNEGKGHEQGHKPKASDPGTGSATTDGKKPETSDANTPNYSTSKVSKNDPSNDPKNKGPSSPNGMQESFEKIEAELVSMLESQGLQPGSEKWNRLFVEGFQFAIMDRAKQVAEAKKAIDAKLAESRSKSA